MKSRLLKLVKKQESEILEFKPSLSQIKDIIETVSAFSNTNGGSIIIGVDDKRNVIGVDVGKKTIESLANEIKQNTDPQIYPSISVEYIYGKNVVIIEVKESKSKPVFAFDRVYKRVGKSNHRVSSDEIREMALEGKKIYWDEQICEDASLEDIDEEKIRRFVKEARRQRGLNISDGTPLKEILIKIKLLKDKKLTNAALLLFSKEPKFLQSEIKCIRFSGNEPVKPYIDFQTLEGSVFNLVDRAEDFVLRNIRKSIWLVPGQVQREEKYEYPPDAIREAVTNAVVHRDYNSPSKVQVRVFDNRIEVWSPGLLPNEITIDDLKREHRSIPRNPLLFKQFFWIRYVEDVGGGTLDMIRQCKEWGIPEPEFKFVTGAFVVVFSLPPSLDDLKKLGLNERQIKGVEYVMKKGSIANKEYTELNSVSRKTATLDLDDLTKKGVFLRVGKGKRVIKYMLLRKDYAKMTQKITQKSSEKHKYQKNGD